MREKATKHLLKRFTLEATVQLEDLTLEITYNDQAQKESGVTAHPAQSVNSGEDPPFS